MHETVVAGKIIAEAKKHGDVTGISLEIGELAHVPAAELVACLGSLVDWKIRYTKKNAHVQCACGFAGRPHIIERGHDFFFIECPHCKQVPKIIAGTDILIKSVEVR